MQFLGLSAWLAVAAAAAAAPAVVPPDVAGRWQGTIHVPGADVESVVDLARNEGRSWIGSMVAPALALPGTPVSELSVEGAQVRFMLKGVLGEPRFEGRLRPDGTLAGLVLLGGNQAPFELKRTGSPEVEAQNEVDDVRQMIEAQIDRLDELEQRVRALEAKFDAGRGSAADGSIPGQTAPTPGADSGRAPQDGDAK